MTALLSMADAAARIGYAYDTFRKLWRDMARDQGFPMPFRDRPYLWRPADIEAWQDRRVKELARIAAVHNPRPVAGPRPARRDAVAEARARMVRAAGGRG